MSIEDLLRDLAGTLADVPTGTAGELREEFIRSCRRIDGDRREQQRIDDIADLLDAEETLYAQARAAAGRGDASAAVPLLRQCAEAGTGEAAWLLAQMLEDLGNISEAITSYQRARDDGDARADEKLAALRAWPCPLASITDRPQDDHAATAACAPVTFLSHQQNSALASAADLADLVPDLQTSLWPLLAVVVHQVPNVAPSILPVVFSDPDCDHLASLAALWRNETRNRLAHDTAFAGTIMKLAQIEARRSTLLRNWDWVLHDQLTFWSRRAAEPNAVAARALLHLTWQDHDLPCATNLNRYLGLRWDTRPPAREPIAADMMLPPSEVPECRPDTTLIEALEQLVQSGTQALPVCEMSRVVGIVRLADLARHINDHPGVPPATVKALMRPATIVPAGTPLSAITRPIADDGIIVVSGSGDRPAGYLTAESILTQAPRPAAGGRPPAQDRPPLLIAGTGAVLLGRSR